MKSDDLMVMAAAAVGVFLFYGWLDNKKTAGQVGYANPVTKIMDFGGWQYFSDGTSIGPDGAYYYQGKQVTLGNSGGFGGAPAGSLF